MSEIAVQGLVTAAYGLAVFATGFWLGRRSARSSARPTIDQTHVVLRDNRVDE